MQRAVLGLRQDRGLCWASGRTEGCVGPQAGQSICVKSYVLIFRFKRFYYVCVLGFNECIMTLKMNPQDLNQSFSNETLGPLWGPRAEAFTMQLCRDIAQPKCRDILRVF